jgi:hypothetical protein
LIIWLMLVNDSKGAVANTMKALGSSLRPF